MIPSTSARFHFDFLKSRKTFFWVSAALALAGLVSLILKGGPRLGIEFTGGTLIQVRLEKPMSLEAMRQVLAQGQFAAELQSIPSTNSFIIRIAGEAAKTQEVSERLREHLQQSLIENPYVLERAEFIGPAIGRHLMRQALLAIVLSLGGIIVYVAFRFKSGIWGFAGVLALAHDVFITVGLFSVFNREITLTVVAALLTLAGYSINDTIVIFDRIRENLRLSRKEPLYQLVNRSLNETLSRTIITSLTVFLVLLALFFFGGEVIHDFSFALLFGVVIGSYSTLFIATPLVYSWGQQKQR